MGMVSAVHRALVFSNVTDEEEGCGDLVILSGWIPPYLSDLPALGRVFLQLWF